MYRLYKTKPLSWNRDILMASRRGQTLLAVFLFDARFAHAACHCFNSGAVLCTDVQFETFQGTRKRRFIHNGAHVRFILNNWGRKFYGKKRPQVYEQKSFLQRAKILDTSNVQLPLFVRFASMVSLFGSHERSVLLKKGEKETKKTRNKERSTKQSPWVWNSGTPHGAKRAQ